ncbi:glucosyltransferase domain-containing protein [Clostridium sp. CMCC3677]|uniref:glucosyltransferase domain-containing protein n=1 Tax=Clostridium sp. CMCC3677 TaxID=2949963 RepID=UPI0013F0E0C7|nr:glucosyltransferase domain-containing protein [Clostridium sp. CMCC3677]NFG60731.1 hypothetical protein [Clostridium botulinum]NFQ08165.1 hypothetical protein [Clostridium botulinum]
MQKFISNIRNIYLRDKRYIWVSILVPFIFYILYGYTHVSADGYIMLDNPQAYTPYEFVKVNGRFGLDIFLGIMHILNFYPVENQLFFTALACLILSINIYLIYYFIKQIVKKNTHVDRLLFLATITLFCNVFYTDWIVWTETVCFTFIPAALCGLLSGKVLLSQKGNKIFNYFLSALLLILGFGFYQTSGVYFYLVCTIFMLGDYLEGHSIKKFFITLIKAITIFCYAAGSQLIISKIYSLQRANYSQVDIMNNIKNILHSSLWTTTLNALPKYTYILFLLSGIISLIYVILKLKRVNKTCVSLIIILNFIGIVAITFLPHVIGNQFWMVWRTTTGFILLPGWLYIMAGILCQAEKKEDFKLNNFKFKVCGLIIIIYLGINYYQTQQVILGNHITNRLDRQETLYFYNEILEYEKETGMEVNKLAFTGDENYKWAYDNVFSFGDINVRAAHVEWCVLPMYNYYTNRKFLQSEIPEEIKKKMFAAKNWDELNKQQIYIEDDTAYICIY